MKGVGFRWGYRVLVRGRDIGGFSSFLGYTLFGYEREF